jgi:hypothetical protein
MMNCRVCSSENIDPFSRATILGKYEVQYFRCRYCGFTFTEEPYWLDEAYSDAIAAGDMGLVRRNVRHSEIVRSVIAMLFDAGGKFLDYGGGYGLFVRIMRDAGYDFYRYDKHCANLFARNFEAEDIGDGPISLVTAFEVLEHLANPVEELDKMLAFSRNLLFATELMPDTAPGPDEWWYYGLDHGQHVSFFTNRSLRILAERFSLHLCTNGRSMHLLTEKNISPIIFKAVACFPVARVLAAICRRKSLVWSDYSRITEWQFAACPGIPERKASGGVKSEKLKGQAHD